MRGREEGYRGGEGGGVPVALAAFCGAGVLSWCVGVSRPPVVVSVGGAVLLLAAAALLMPGPWRGTRGPGAKRLRGRQRLLATMAVAALSGAVVLGVSVQERWRFESQRDLRAALGEERRELEVHVRIEVGPVPMGQGYSYDARLIGSDEPELNALMEGHEPRVRLFYGEDQGRACEILPMPGDEVRAWARVARFVPRTNPWQSSARELMEARGYLATATLRERPEVRVAKDLSASLRLRRWLTGQRLDLERRIALHLEGDGLAVTWAMLTASRGLIRPEFREPFDMTSTSHVLAISGLHFGVIAALIALSLRLLFDRVPRLYCFVPRRRLLVLPSLILLLGYLVAIGAPVSAQRAFLMAALASLALFVTRRVKGTSVLWMVGTLLLWGAPRLLFEIGFQLSMSATAGILLFHQGRPAWLRPQAAMGQRESVWVRRRRAVGLFIGVSTAASVATLPPLIAMSGELPVSGFWTNLVVIPVVGSLIFPLMVAGALLTGVWPWLAGVLLRWGAGLFVRLFELLDVVAYWPLNELRLGYPERVEWAAMWVACWLAVRGGLRLRPCLVAILIWGVGLVPGSLSVTLRGDEAPLKVHMIDVGQGDATLLELPDGTTMLIDAGGSLSGQDPGLRKVAPYLRKLGIRRLDVLLLTHADLDHYGGLDALLRPFAPRVFLARNNPAHARTYQTALTAKALGAHVPRLPERLVLSAAGARLTLLTPPDTLPSENDRSIVVIVEYGQVAIALTGDLEEAGERWLLTQAHHLPTPAAVYKAGHHGSRTSSSPELLNYLQPTIALVSAGRPSPFGHPHVEVLERFEARGIDVFRTDTHGSTRIEVDADGTLRVFPARWPDGEEP
ncbi:DNA internalization-related competence protein ComEC/Rec2 [Lujinxingia vulgaris]|uniref:DNA internalization-related competence protein ComEC/Rec2 n=1 Tax=Lujinxingia vulgaris TaxID=2600176 RepID=A0A5C6X7I7_9DELT|nr:DNA internalization-related competence protein ComEC/Rec2 [Lujinxingia vulgaris]TXD35687.1 DNA internalization-related competence protein ComEC/Rec2 [Lujinxingia vulgaris]